MKHVANRQTDRVDSNIKWQSFTNRSCMIVGVQAMVLGVMLSYYQTKISALNLSYCLNHNCYCVFKAG